MATEFARSMLISSKSVSRGFLMNLRETSGGSAIANGFDVGTRNKEGTERTIASAWDVHRSDLSTSDGLLQGRA